MQEEIQESIVEQEVQPQQQEKLFNQQQVSDVVRRERERAYEKAKREAMDEARQAGVSSGLTPEQIRQMAIEAASGAIREQKQKQAEADQLQQMNQVVGSFVNKIEASSERYPNLKEKLRELDFESFAPIVALATDLENTADIINHLVDDPMKMSSLLTLLDRQPQMAAKAVYELSNSLKNNEAALAKNLEKANAPFDTINRSGNTLQSEENMSVSDFRKLFR